MHEIKATGNSFLDIIRSVGNGSINGDVSDDCLSYSVLSFVVHAFDQLIVFLDPGERRRAHVCLLPGAKE